MFLFYYSYLQYTEIIELLLTKSKKLKGELIQMIRKEQQRFSLRKYKVGVASVFLGTTLSFMMANEGAVKASELPTQPSSVEKTELVKKDSSSEDSSKKEENAVDNVATTELAETNKVEEVKPADNKPADNKPAENKPASEAKTEEVKSEPVSSEKAEEAKPAITEAKAVAESPASTSEKAAEAKPATDESNKPRVRNRRATTEDAVSGDHNTKPVSVSTYLKDGETVDPTIQNPNGATVKSQDVPTGYARKEGDWYTYSIVDLEEFNKRYNTNYYSRAYKRFDGSSDTIVELIDKTTGNVVETRTITASSGIQKFTTTTTASRGELTYQVDFSKGTAPKGEEPQPFIQYGFDVAANIQALVAPGHTLTTEEQKLYNAVYAARTSRDIINVVEPAYNGRTITDTNAKIPEFVEKTTYYKVVDKNNATFNANKTDATVQDYKENGNEVDLAKYTTKAMEGQNFTASGERQFDGYKLYQTADPDTTTGYVSRPYKVGTKFMDAERAGIKRIKEIVGEDGTVVVRVYLLDPKQKK